MVADVQPVRDFTDKNLEGKSMGKMIEVVFFSGSKIFGEFHASVALTTSVSSPIPASGSGVGSERQKVQRMNHIF
jgi:hypothetical protein